MSRRSPLTAHNTAVRCLLAVTLLALPLLASHLEAQTRAAARREPHRLTEHMMIKVSTIMNEWDPLGPPFLHPKHDADRWRQGTQLVWDVGVEARRGKTALIERTPALETAIQRAGLTPALFNAAFDAYTTAQQRLFEEGLEEMSGEKSKNSSPPATGIALENQELMRRLLKDRDLWTIM